MRQTLSLLRSEATARTASVMFAFAVAFVCGAQAGRGMTGDQWMAAAAAVAGALLVAILVHGRPEATRSRN